MTLSISELSTARDQVGGMLEELGLVAYRYEVEPADEGGWRLIVECRTPDGWKRVELVLEPEAVDGGSAAARSRGLSRVADALSECARTL